MFVNLTDVFRDEDKTVTMQIEPETEQVMIGGETFPVTGKKPLHLILSNVGKGEARITGSGEITFLARWRRHWSFSLTGQCLRRIGWPRLKKVMTRGI